MSSPSVAAKTVSAASGWEKSARTTLVWTPYVASISLASSWSFSSRRPTITTLIPPSAIFSQKALPTPSVAPRITPHSPYFSRRFIMLSLAGCGRVVPVRHVGSGTQ